MMKVILGFLLLFATTPNFAELKVCGGQWFCCSTVANKVVTDGSFCTYVIHNGQKVYLDPWNCEYRFCRPGEGPLL